MVVKPLSKRYLYFRKKTTKLESTTFVLELYCVLRAKQQVVWVIPLFRKCWLDFLLLFNMVGSGVCMLKFFYETLMISVAKKKCHFFFVSFAWTMKIYLFFFISVCAGSSFTICEIHRTTKRKGTQRGWLYFQAKAYRNVDSRVRIHEKLSLYRTEVDTMPIDEIRK